MNRRDALKSLGTLSASLALANIQILGQQNKENDDIFDRILYDR